MRIKQKKGIFPQQLISALNKSQVSRSTKIRKSQLASELQLCHTSNLQQQRKLVIQLGCLHFFTSIPLHHKRNELVKPAFFYVKANSISPKQICNKSSAYLLFYSSPSFTRNICSCSKPVREHFLSMT